ncbi:hypothetical protein HYALB_00001731 [Hymenoscyphus albidus]|uniref:Uncharacterized protein n=1 Tax=Hymenoscyphus albidus TaxID=595503 RepID=A0A9N9PRE1_9HELO|nr:hypothetical protein HYALB_00001731 [Hymenoscyphus albidus]
MIRDAWLLSSALRDDSTTAQLQHWHKELELWEICRARTELETRLAELESRGNKLTQSLEEDKTCPSFHTDELWLKAIPQNHTLARAENEIAGGLVNDSESTDYGSMP